MKKTIPWIIVLLVSLPAPLCMADQTIYCPQNPVELQQQCFEANQKFMELESMIEHLESVTSSNLMLVISNVPMGQESFEFNGQNYPVRARFQYNGAQYIPLTPQECYTIFGTLYRNSRSKFESEMGAIRRNTMVMKQQIWQNLQQARRDHQHYTLFRAQCCGRRWTNDPAVEERERPQPGPGRGLLNVPGLD